MKRLTLPFFILSLTMMPKAWSLDDLAPFLKQGSWKNLAVRSSTITDNLPEASLTGFRTDRGGVRLKFDTPDLRTRFGLKVKTGTSPFSWDQTCSSRTTFRERISTIGPIHFSILSNPISPSYEYLLDGEGTSFTPSMAENAPQVTDYRIVVEGNQYSSSLGFHMDIGYRGYLSGLERELNRQFEAQKGSFEHNKSVSFELNTFDLKTFACDLGKKFVSVRIEAKASFAPARLPSYSWIEDNEMIRIYEELLGQVRNKRLTALTAQRALGKSLKKVAPTILFATKGRDQNLFKALFKSDEKNKSLSVLSQKTEDELRELTSLLAELRAPRSPVDEDALVITMNKLTIEVEK